MIVLAQAATALVLLYAGGEAVIRGASSLASGLGVSKLAIGLTVVAFGTSSPELIVSVDAALSGANDIALGNVVGSNIANVSLILGLSALIRPIDIHAKVGRVDVPIMVLASGMLLLVLTDARVTRFEAVLLLLGLVAYTGFTFWEARGESGDVRTEFEGAVPASSLSPGMSLGVVAIGLGVLVLAGHLLVTAAVALATAWGLSQAVIGLTIVSVGTSMPETAATVVAALRQRGDVAVGNIVGSNLFNILGIVGIGSLLHPLVLGSITWVDLWVMMLIPVPLAVGLLVRGRMGRLEGAAMVAVFILYTAWRVGAAS